ncbi:type II toxin-antitoxin system RelE/ParE family toxin [Legionella worsleiensis]|uniref:type II toxin-antitoxin system RelE/ParE family toxin n=1 Tax=Legionella worsleiensis TaxID=45076 RepID=UPI000E0E5F9F|nr:type II toxin-antitoxin system RelE/ParE family toxin [Legionella worsleiensis]
MLVETLDGFFKLSRNEQLKYSLGAGLYKLRIATKEGRGKSGGSRSILAFKNDKGNVTTSELKKLKHLVDIIFALTDEQISKLINLREFCEVSTKV